MRRILLLMLLCAFRLHALERSVVNLGTPAVDYATNEPFLINVGAGPFNYTLTSYPKGTIYLTVKNSSGVTTQTPPVIIAPERDAHSSATVTLMFAAEGDYEFSAYYAGDTYYAPSVSTYTWSVHLTDKPGRYSFITDVPSLTFPSGATTGNTVTVTHQTYNGCCDLTEDRYELVGTAGEYPATPATLVNDLVFVNGETASRLTIKTITPFISSASPGPRLPYAPLLPAMAGVLCLPFAMRRRKLRTLMPVIIAAALSGLMGCGASTGGNSEGPYVPQSRSSAGHYVLHLTGRSQGPLPMTLAIPRDILVTVQ